MRRFHHPPLSRLFARVRRRAYTGPISDHFDGRRFFNPWDNTARNILGFFKWRLTAKSAPWPSSRPNARMDVPPQRVHGDALRLTFIGHATVLVQTANLNILTDPVWSDRASPFDSKGPKRVHAPGIPFDRLPPIDVVLVSHNHYDHLDLPTLAALWRRDRPRVVAPLGNAALIGRACKGLSAVELDWWDSTEVTPGHTLPAGRSASGTPARVGRPDDHGEAMGVRIHAVPSHHWSARGVFDRRAALWASFVIEAPGGAIYFCGDSGYGAGVPFKLARERFGSFRVALLPIGAYEPRWFMAPAHMNPEEAVLAFLDLNAERAAALHHGVFHLTDEGIDRPLMDLAAAMARHGVSPEQFLSPLVGEGWDVPTRL